MVSNQFVYYSTSNAAKTVVGTSTPVGGTSWTGMAEHPSGTVYAISTDCGGTTYLYTINPSNGAATQVGQVTGITCAINLAADGAGNLYTFDISSDNIYSINPSTAAPTLLGPAGFDGNYAQGMDYDKDNSIMYMAAYSGSAGGELRTVNLTTGATTLIGPFQGNAEVDGIAIVSCLTGPNLIVQSTSFVDTCSAGGPGDANGIAEPGEVLNISPVIFNSGTAPATNVQATISTANPLVTIIVGNANYGNINNGSSASPAAPFQVLLDPTIACPSVIDFNINITSNEGSWTGTFQINVGGTGSATQLLNEAFESWPPAGWTIIDEQPGWSCDVWQSTAYWGVTNDTGGSGEAADADADACGGGMDTSLITPPIDLSGFASATLSYRCNFQDFAGNGDAWTDISTDGGSTWINLRHETTDDPVSGHLVNIDLSPYIGNTIQIRFHFYTPDWDWFWQVDDVIITGSTVTCNICAGCPPPGTFNLISPANGATGIPVSGVTLDWQDSTGATSYNLYFGTAPTPPLYQSGITASQFNVSSLAYGTTYYWRVEAVNSCGTTSSSIWSFTTVSVTPCTEPDTPTLISPPNGSTGLEPPVTLTWSGGNTDYYEVYLGTAPNQLNYLASTTNTSYVLNNLSEGVTYYWMVNAVNDCGFKMSEIWSFTMEGLPQPEENINLIPVVANTTGARSSHWVTDLQIFNPTDKKVNFTMYLIPPGIDGTQTPYTYAGYIESKKLLVYNDIITNTFGLSEIFGSLQIVSDGKIIATSRTYNQTENGTYGQFVKGYAIEDAIGIEGSRFFIRQNETAHLINLINSVNFRSNVGFMEIKGKLAKVNISIYDNSNNLLGTGSYDLLPKGFLQINDVFTTIGISGFFTAARAELTLNGEGAVFGYASIVDNNSNDAIFVPALKEKENFSSQSFAVAVHTPGDKGTFWRSDLKLFNLSENEEDITFSFVSKGQLYTEKIKVSGKGICDGRDLIQQLFKLSEDYGTLKVTSPANFISTSRIYTSSEQETYGQFVPSTLIHTPILIGQTQYVLHLSSTDSYRSNFGLAEISGKAVTVEVTLYDANGTQIAKGTYNLSGYELKQINKIFDTFNLGTVENAYAKVTVLSGDGAVLTYGSVVDNITGDAIYVIGQ